VTQDLLECPVMLLKREKKDPLVRLESLDRLEKKEIVDWTAFLVTRAKRVTEETSD
jgi:hypothetical protein